MAPKILLYSVFFFVFVTVVNSLPVQSFGNTGGIRRDVKATQCPSSDGKVNSKEEDKPGLMEEASSAQGIISNSLNKTGNVAGDILNSAGKLAKDDIDMKSSVIGGALDGAGQAASSALQKSGQAAAQAASNIDNSLKNTYTRFGK